MSAVELLVEFVGSTKELKEATAEATGTLEKFAKGAKKAGALAGATVGAALVEGLGTALDNEEALTKFKVQVGDAKWADNAGKAAGQLYANAYGDSVAGNADAIRSVFAAGLLKDDATTDQIAALTGRAESLAQAFDQDVGGAATAAGQLIKTGMAKNADEAFDLIAKGFSAGADKRGDFLDTLNEYGVQFKKLGLEGPTAIGLISQGLQGGARDADLVADALKEFSIRAVDGSKTTADGFKALGLGGKAMGAEIGKGGTRAEHALMITLKRLREMKDPVKQAQAATALFGTQAEDLGSALFALDTDKATAKIGKFKGAAAEIDKQLGGTTKASLEAFKRQMEQALGDAVAKVLPKIQGLLADLKPFQPLLVPFIVALGAFAAAVGTVTVAMKIWRGMVLLHTAAMWLLNAAFLANPVIGLTVAIVAVVAAIVLAYKHSTRFREAVQALWAKIKEFGAGAVAVFKAIPHAVSVAVAAIVGIAKKGVDLYIGMWKKIFDVVVGVPGKVKAVFTGAGKWLLDAGKQVMAGLATGIKDAALAPVNAAKGAVKSVIGSVKSGFGIFSPSRVMRTLGEFTMDGLTLGIKARTPIAVKAVKDATNALIDAAKEKISAAKDIARQISDAFSTDLTTGLTEDVKGKDGKTTTRKVSLIESLKRQADQAEAFTRQIAILRRGGLQGGLIDELVAGGPSSLAAAQELGAGPSSIRQANSLFGRITAAGGALGASEAQRRTGINIAAPNVDVRVEIDGKQLEATVHTVVDKRDRKAHAKLRAGSGATRR